MFIKRRVPLAALALAFSLAAGPVLAHNLILEAYAIGNSIEGQAFFSDGIFAKNSLIEVAGPDGAKLAEFRTDDKGGFTYTPTKPVDQRLRLDMGSGHVASVTVAAAKFAGGAALPLVAAPSGQAAPPPAVAAGQAELDRLIAAELEPLRNEITAYKDHNDRMNLLAAIGLLCGAAGLLLFNAGAQRVKASGKARPSARSAPTP